MDATAKLDRAWRLLSVAPVSRDKDNASTKVPLWIVAPLLSALLYWAAKYMRKHWHEQSAEAKQRALDVVSSIRDGLPSNGPKPTMWLAVTNPFDWMIGRAIGIFCVAILRGAASDKKALDAYHAAVASNPRLAEVMTRDYSQIRLEDTIPAKMERVRHRTG